MKFQHLPMGAHFEFDGKVYAKVSPILGEAVDGSGRRMIPRYALLKPVPGVGEQLAPPDAPQIDRERVMAAFEAFHNNCAHLLDGACAADSERREALQAALAEARRQFLHSLSGK